MIKVLEHVFLAEYFHVFSILRCRFPVKPMACYKQWNTMTKINHKAQHK